MKQECDLIHRPVIISPVSHEVSQKLTHTEMFTRGVSTYVSVSTGFCICAYAGGDVFRHTPFVHCVLANWKNNKGCLCYLKKKKIISDTVSEIRAIS